MAETPYTAYSYLGGPLWPLFEHSRYMTDNMYIRGIEFA
jgi:hypothetical protein